MGQRRTSADAGRGAAQQLGRQSQRGRRHVAARFAEFPRAHGTRQVFRRSRLAVDERQPLQRVGQVGAQGHTQPGQLGADGRAVARAQVEGGHRGQAGLGQFAVQVQVAPQRAAAHRQHGVVDAGAGHRAADGLEFVEHEAPRLEHAMRRDHRIEARRRQLVRAQQQVAGQRQRRRRGTPHGAPQRPGQAGGGAHAVRHAAPDHAQHSGRPLGEPWGGRRIGRRRGVQVVQQRRDLVAVFHVDGGVVHLRQQRKAAGGQVQETVEPFDDVDLPQRAVQVQRPGVDARGLNAELAPVAGFGQRDVAHMVFQVELLVVHPVRKVQVQRHAAQLAAQDGQLVQAAGDARQDGLEAHPAAGRRGLVVDVDERDVGVRVRGIGVQERGVVGAELWHAEGVGRWGAPMVARNSRTAAVKCDLERPCLEAAQACAVTLRARSQP